MTSENKLPQLSALSVGLLVCLSLFHSIADTTQIDENLRVLPLIAITLATAGLLALWAQSFLQSKLNNLLTVSYFSVLSLLIFYKPSLFFVWDEWNLIQRLEENGIQAIFTSHNEHFLPLGFLAYLCEIKLFGSDYTSFLIVSSVIHGLNCFILMKLTELMTSNWDRSAQLGKIVALLFLVSALHTETLHWAFLQTLLLSTTCIFSSCYFAKKYFNKEEASSLLLCAVFAALAPLFFGNGFVVIFLIAGICLQSLFEKPLEEIHQTKIYKSLKLLLLTGLSLLLPAVLYLTAMEQGSGHTLDQADMLDSPKHSLKYLAYGSQLGTVVRGLGLYPGLSYGEARNFFNLHTEKPLLNSVAEYQDPENIYFYIGVLLSVFSGLFALSRNEKYFDGSTSFWLCGQFWIAAAFILPALGRYQFGGYPASFALRYQYLALPGLFIFLLPVFHSLLTTKRSGRLLYAICSLYIYSNLLNSGNFDYFTSRGEANKKFIQQLRNKELSAKALKENAPLTLTPNRTAQEIKNSLNWLEKEAALKINLHTENQNLLKFFSLQK